MKPVTGDSGRECPGCWTSESLGSFVQRTVSASLLEVPSLSTDQLKREGPESGALSGELPDAVLSSFVGHPHAQLCSSMKDEAGGGAQARSHLVYDRFQLKLSSRLEEGETSRFCRLPQRRRPPKNEARRLLSPFSLSSIRKNSVKALKESRMTSWLQAGRGSRRRKPQWPP